jgi:hypothetical protein
VLSLVSKVVVELELELSSDIELDEELSDMLLLDWLLLLSERMLLLLLSEVWLLLLDSSEA